MSPAGGARRTIVAGKSACRSGGDASGVGGSSIGNVGGSEMSELKEGEGGVLVGILGAAGGAKACRGGLVGDGNGDDDESGGPSAENEWGIMYGAE